MSDTTQPNQDSTDSIWSREITLDELNATADGTMTAHLDIRFTEVGPSYLRATMPVDPRTHQPFGLLHGGASVALAETLGSTAANCCIDAETHYCVGLEVNANHMRSVRSGTVVGTARPLHRGQSTHVWQINIRDQEQHLVCASRLTLAVLQR